MPQHLLFLTGVAQLLALLVASSVVAQVPAGCPDTQLVYPYWTFCGGQPAVYGDAFYIVSARSWTARGGLVSELDETNQTYYMRLTGSLDDWGTLYTLLPEDPSLLGTPIPWNGRVLITSNPDSSSVNGFLAWRSEGEGEWFLEELHDCNSTCLPATFNIVYAPPDLFRIALACPFIWPPPHCEMYVLTSTPGTYTSGLASYVENGVTYITLGEEGTPGNLPIVFRRPSSSSVTTTANGAVRMVV